MLKMITAGFIIFATTAFGMSLSKLNSANKTELMEINGVGEVKANAIIKERKKSRFKSFDDLSQRVTGVGEQLGANIKNDVKVGEKPKKAKAQKKKSTKSTKAEKSKKPTKSKTKTKTKTKAKSKTKTKSKAKSKKEKDKKKS